MLVMNHHIAQYDLILMTSWFDVITPQCYSIFQSKPSAYNKQSCEAKVKSLLHGTYNSSIDGSLDGDISRLV